MKWGYKKRER
jgi:hypothetical protein